MLNPDVSIRAGGDSLEYGRALQLLIDKLTPELSLLFNTQNNETVSVWLVVSTYVCNLTSLFLCLSAGVFAPPCASLFLSIVCLGVLASIIQLPSTTAWIKASSGALVNACSSRRVCSGFFLLVTFKA